MSESDPKLDWFAEFFDEKARWSEATFGPGDRYDRVVAHIRKELKEIEAKPDDLEEWVDITLLAMDGAWRSANADGNAFSAMLRAKHDKNLQREWPDWRTLGPGQVAEHVRQEGEAAKAPDATFFVVPINGASNAPPMMMTTEGALNMAVTNHKRATTEGRAQAIETFAGLHGFILRREVGSVFYSRYLVAFCMVEATALYRTTQDMPPGDGQN